MSSAPITIRSKHSCYYVCYLLQAYDDTGDYFPIWGTCLGFEMLCVIQQGSTAVLSGYDADNYTIPLQLIPGII